MTLPYLPLFAEIVVVCLDFLAPRAEIVKGGALPCTSYSKSLGSKVASELTSAWTKPCGHGPRAQNRAGETSDEACAETETILCKMRSNEIQKMYEIAECFFHRAMWQAEGRVQRTMIFFGSRIPRDQVVVVQTYSRLRQCVAATNRRNQQQYAARFVEISSLRT